MNTATRENGGMRVSALMCWNPWSKWVSNRANGATLTQWDGVSQSNGAKTICNIFFFFSPVIIFLPFELSHQLFYARKIFALFLSVCVCVCSFYMSSIFIVLRICYSFLCSIHRGFCCEFYSCQTLRWLTKRFSINAPLFFFFWCRCFRFIFHDFVHT